MDAQSHLLSIPPMHLTKLGRREQSQVQVIMAARNIAKDSEFPAAPVRRPLLRAEIMNAGERPSWKKSSSTTDF